MNKNYLSSFAIFFLVGVITLLARSKGWYNDYWYTDVILHTMSGVGFGFLWLGLNNKIYSQLQPWNRALCIVSFAAFGSVLWEFWEFFGWHITPTHTRFYIPELGDSLSDIFCGIIGGGLTSLILIFYPFK